MKYLRVFALVSLAALSVQAVTQQRSLAQVIRVPDAPSGFAPGAERPTPRHSRLPMNFVPSRGPLMESTPRSRAAATTEKAKMPKTTKVLTASSLRHLVPSERKSVLNTSSGELVLRFRGPGKLLRSVRVGNILVAGVTR